MLTAQHASELCGYSVNALNRWRNLEQIQGGKYRNELWYPKESLAYWLVSTKGQAIAAPSQPHQEWMKGFQEEEQDGGMEFGSMPLSSINFHNKHDPTRV